MTARSSQSAGKRKPAGSKPRKAEQMPKNDGRKTDGTFDKGNRLGGSKIGSRHRVTRAIEALLEGQHEALTAKAVEMALAELGEVWLVPVDRER